MFQTRASYLLRRNPTKIEPHSIPFGEIERCFNDGESTAVAALDEQVHV